ncbi:phosphoenolpyruvate carboxylase kinase 1-like isoform X2 [Lycium barbarum]|uniref:phosphoenolpyruvate carboxylase kinase 1-like isoform X2 n=1 Tax=Lycium barbarum TaxID=112863 RepID=UPI00293E5263|nr:phosphoenolpyruvate carboxylase kinase 1-like isoform X2 [Lycium barbarum]
MSEALKRNYQVCEELGKGRFGVVFKCYSPKTGEKFAVKSINKLVIADDSIDRQCIYNEAKIMQLVSPNPHIVRIEDVYEDDTYLDIVMELCESSDLFQRLETQRVFSESDAIAVMVPLMEAVTHCHKVGVAHRDIKPDNILFNDRNALKLADFGSAECFRHGELMSGVVDIWSAGIILYIMLAGIPPFYGDSTEEIFEAVLRANLRFPTRIFQSVSPAAKDLLRGMLCKDVSRRFSAEQVRRGSERGLRRGDSNLHQQGESSVSQSTELLDSYHLRRLTCRDGCSKRPGCSPNTLDKKLQCIFRVNFLCSCTYINF